MNAPAGKYNAPAAWVIDSFLCGNGLYQATVWHAQRPAVTVWVSPELATREETIALANAWCEAHNAHAPEHCGDQSP